MASNNFSCAFEEHLNGMRWTAPDAMASEYEAADFLYGLIRLLKPKLCIETGCYKGNATLAIGKALLLNGSGILQSCDTDQAHVLTVMTECQQNYYPVTLRQCTGVELIKALDGPPNPQKIDFAFLDSSGDRVEEAQALNISDNAIIALHDARRPEFWHLKDLGWQSVFMPTPRGMALFQKNT